MSKVLIHPLNRFFNNRILLGGSSFSGRNQLGFVTVENSFNNHWEMISFNIYSNTDFHYFFSIYIWMTWYKILGSVKYWFTWFIMYFYAVFGSLLSSKFQRNSKIFIRVVVWLFGKINVWKILKIFEEK